MTDPITRKTSNLSNYYIKKGNVINNLTSNDTDKPLSAKQGKELKSLIDNIEVTPDIDLDDYIQKSQTNGLVKNDGSIDTNTYLTEHQSLTNYLQKNDVINNLTSDNTDKALSAKQGKELKTLIDSLNPDGPELDLTDYIQKSNITGLVKNDGSIDENTYLTEHQSLTNYIQKSNTSGLVKNDGTIDENTYLTEHQSLTNYIQKSNTSGLVKNDGTVDTNTYLKTGDITVPTKTSDLTNDGDGTNIFLVSSDLANYIQTSNTSGLMKNDGTIDTNTYLQVNDAFSGSYNDLTDKPSIPSKTSDLTNDSNFLSSVEISDVVGLSDALSSTLSYQPIQGSVSEMQQAASDLNYSENPNSEQGDIFEWYLTEVKDIETEENVIYLLENNDGFFNEYLKVYDGEDYKFELLGSTEIDISGKEDRSNKVSTWSNLVSSNYPSATLVKNSLDNKVDKETGKGLFSGSYNDLTNKPTIPDVSGKIDTAGTGLSKSNGTTLNHSNSITPQTSAVFKKFTYDGQGHITGITDVEESDLPNHNHDYINNTMNVGSNSVIWASPDINNDGNADVLSSNKCSATFYKQGKFVILYLHLVGKNPHTTTNYLPYINQISPAYAPRDSFYHSMPNLHRDTSVTLYFHQSGSAWVVDARIAKVDSDATQNTVNCYGMISYPTN